MPHPPLSPFPKEGGNEAQKGVRWAQSAPAPLFAHNSPLPESERGRGGAKYDYFEKTLLNVKETIV